MLARLAKAAEQGVLLVTHDNADLMWLRRHVGTDDIAEPEPYLFCFQHDWVALTPAERALRTIKGLAEFHPDWAFWGYDAALLWVWRCRMICLGHDILLRQVARCR